MIKLESITFEYEDKIALDSFNLQIQAGEKIALLGNNGSGKSTILKILAGIYFANKGDYFFQENRVSKRDIKKEFRKKVGVLFQNPESMIFNPTVYDEVAFSLREFGFEDIDARVMQISQEFKMEHLLKKSPLELSGGEKQKVMLASILVYEPEILLLDEPTSSMDPATTGWFVDFLIELNKTVVISTHDIAHAYEMCERGVVIDETHKKIFDGAIEVLLDDLDILLQANLIHKHKFNKNIYNTKYHLHF